MSVLLKEPPLQEGYIRIYLNYEKNIFKDLSKDDFYRTMDKLHYHTLSAIRKNKDEKN